ncbi:MAG TPA: hypothetical protein VGF86_09140 [Candidatus Tumulicola sp.]|jgi:hypothetical protein
MRAAILLVVMGAQVAAMSGCAGRSTPDNGIKNPVLAEVLSPAAMAGGETGSIMDPSSLAPTELRFGRSPKPDPNVTYQSGVIVMPHGDTAITSMESNGIIWHFKADAPQVDQIQEDAVIFATERCVGRVLHVDRTGNDVRVVLGPVQITDVFQKAHFVLDQPLDLTKVIAVAAPDFPNPTPPPAESPAPSSGVPVPAGAPSESPSPLSSPTSTGDASRPRLVAMTYSLVSPDGKWRPFRAMTFDARGAPHRARLQRASRHVPEKLAQAAPGGVPNLSAPDPSGQIPTVDIAGGLDATPCLIKCGGLGLDMTYDQGGIKIYAYAVLYVQNPRAQVNLNIQGGVKSTGIHLTGVAGFKAHYELGADKSFVRNVHLNGDIPIDLTFLVNMLTPVSVHLTQSLILNTGFSARISTISGTFDYAMCCGFGVGYNGTGYGSDGPEKFAEKNHIAGDVTGISVGINSVVLSLRQQVMFGIGVLGFATGPYAGLVESTTILKQSSAATPITLPIGADVGCHQATFQLAVDGGVGWTINRVVVAVVNFFLSVFHTKAIPSKGTFIEIPQQVIIGHRYEKPDKCSG